MCWLWFGSLRVYFLLAVSWFSSATSSSQFSLSFSKYKTLSAKPARVAFLLKGAPLCTASVHDAKCFWRKGRCLLCTAWERYIYVLLSTQSCHGLGIYANWRTRLAEHRWNMVHGIRSVFTNLCVILNEF